MMQSSAPIGMPFRRTREHEELCHVAPSSPLLLGMHDQDFDARPLRHVRELVNFGPRGTCRAMLHT